MKKIHIILISCVALLTLALGIYLFLQKDEEASSVEELKKDVVSYDTDDTVETLPSSYTKITFSDSNINVDGSGATVKGNVITIYDGGAYLIEGSSNDARIVITASKKENVQLFLNNVNLKSSDYAVISVTLADKVIITNIKGTTNILEDSNDYSLTGSEDNTDATIFSKEDLTINGAGTLNLIGNYNNGLVSKDDLKIINTNLSITSVNTAINGKDMVAISNATIKIDAKGNGIKSSNTEDTSLGYITINDSTITVVATEDGIEAETNLSITNCNLTITTGGGSNNSVSSSNATSAKGLKATNNIIIDGGVITLDTSDDGIHSNNSIQIDAGTFQIKSGDDGIHADTNLAINGGTINVTKSYEGLEAATIEITGGTISVVASDDGINAAGGNDNSSTTNRPGGNNFSTSTGTIFIKGGNITINASGDGIDSNGNITMSGGILIIHGPTNGGNGAIDYDGTFNMNGGTLIALGASGMAQTPSSSSTQYIIGAAVTSSSAGTIVSLTDSNDKEIVSVTSEKSYSHIVISSKDITKGTYTLNYGTNSQNITVNSILTTSGSSNNGMGGPGGR